MAIRGQNMPVFKKKGSFLILLGGLGVIFQTPVFHENMLKKKIV